MLSPEQHDEHTATSYLPFMNAVFYYLFYLLYSDTILGFGETTLEKKTKNVGSIRGYHESEPGMWLAGSPSL